MQIFAFPLFCLAYTKDIHHLFYRFKGLYIFEPLISEQFPGFIQKTPSFFGLYPGKTVDKAFIVLSSQKCESGRNIVIHRDDQFPGGVDKAPVLVLYGSETIRKNFRITELRFDD